MSERRTAERTWTPGRRLLLVALVCVQVLVPVAATLHRVPSKLGFHMFTGYEPWSLIVRDAGGELLEVDRSDWIANPREDVAWVDHLAPRICADVAAASVVVIRQWSVDEEYECSR